MQKGFCFATSRSITPTSVLTTRGGAYDQTIPHTSEPVFKKITSTEKPFRLFPPQWEGAFPGAIGVERPAWRRGQVAAIDCRARSVMEAQAQRKSEWRVDPHPRVTAATPTSLTEPQWLHKEEKKGKGTQTAES